MAQIRKSKQREAILAHLQTRHDHPTAEQIFEGVRQEMPNISLGTVYRNLSLLTELGEIRTLYTGTGCDRFDPIMTPHNHFICRKCHCVIDMPAFDNEAMLEEASRACGGQVESCSTYFYGLCEKCN